MQLVLTSTIRQRLAGPLLVRARIIPIADTISSREPDRIDGGRLKARFQNEVLEGVDQLIHLSGDNCVLSLHGRVVVKAPPLRYRSTVWSELRPCLAGAPRDRVRGVSEGNGAQ